MNATEYWMKSLINRSESTRSKYQDFLHRFCEWIDKTPDDLIQQRKEDLKREDVKDKRRFEIELKGFIAHLNEEGFSTSTQQVAYAAIRSFFEAHYIALLMRRGDYPQGENLGYRPATKEDIAKLLDVASLRWKALILVLKDSGLRVSDVRRLSYGDIAKNLEQGEEVIPLTLLTKKNKVIAKTFIGSEAISALKEYLNHRRKGTRRIPFETITENTPLFTTQEKKAHRLSRSAISSGVNHIITMVGLTKEISAHSFRKYFQTQLEGAGVHPNWVMQMMGHKLNGVENHYSRPSGTMLREAYEKAYSNLRIEQDTVDRVKILEEQLREERDRRKQLESQLSTVENQLAGFDALEERLRGMLQKGDIRIGKTSLKESLEGINSNNIPNEASNNGQYQIKLISKDDEEAYVQLLSLGWEHYKDINGKIVLRLLIQ